MNSFRPRTSSTSFLFVRRILRSRRALGESPNSPGETRTPFNLKPKFSLLLSLYGHVKQATRISVLFAQFKLEKHPISDTCCNSVSPYREHDRGWESLIRVAVTVHSATLEYQSIGLLRPYRMFLLVY